MKLRPYQLQAYDDIMEQFASHRSTVAVLATGLGKTVLFVHCGRHGDFDRVMIVAHRRELIDQAANAVRRVTGEEPAIEMGQRRANETTLFDEKCRWVVGSVQTLKGQRLKKFDPSDRWLLIIDECHHATAASYWPIYHHFMGGNPKSKLLGVTATPERSDGIGLGNMFASEACQYGVNYGIDNAWLVPLKCSAIHDMKISIEHVEKAQNKHGLNAAQMRAVMMSEDVLHGVAQKTNEIAAGRQGVMFCLDCAHAKRLSEVLNYYGAISAYVDDETTDEERLETVNRYKANEIQYLCNYGIFTEGFDAPATSVVGLLRPTRSVSVVTQMVGRGTRVLEGILDGLDTIEDRKAAIAASPKPHCDVLDFVGFSQRHKLASVYDVLGGNDLPQDVLDAAATITSAGQVTVSDAIRIAKLESDVRRLIQAAIDEEERQHRDKVRAAHQVHVHARVDSTSLFDHRDRDRSRTGHIPESQGRELATEKQVHRLVSYGIPHDVAITYSKAKAGTIIGKRKKAEKEAVNAASS